MLEAPLPTQSVVSKSLPPPAPLASRPGAPSKLRASLVACSAEGLVAEIVGACLSGAVVTAWGLLFDASPLLLGVLWGLPHVGQILQLPASWVTTRFGRRRVAIAMHALARQVTAPIALLPFLHVTTDVKRTLLVALFAASCVLSVLGHNAWLSWMGDLVPSRVRGAYFGRRSALCTVASTAASLAMACALDAGRGRSVLGGVLAAVVLLRSLAGIATTTLMLRQHDPARDAPSAPSLRELTAPLADRRYRRLLAYRAAWGVATGVTASLSALLTLRALGLGFVGVALYAALVAGLRALTTPAWGRFLDRLGGRPVLVVSSLGAALASVSWLGATAGAPWLIAVDAVVSGLVLGGQELAVFTLPLSASPSRQRPLFAAASVMVGGVAYGLASVLGGALAIALSASAILLLSVALRMFATLLAARIDDPHSSRGKATLVEG